MLAALKRGHAWCVWCVVCVSSHEWVVYSFDRNLQIIEKEKGAGRFAVCAGRAGPRRCAVAQWLWAWGRAARGAGASVTHTASHTAHRTGLSHGATYHARQSSSVEFPSFVLFIPSRVFTSRALARDNGGCCRHCRVRPPCRDGGTRRRCRHGRYDHPHSGRACPLQGSTELTWRARAEADREGRAGRPHGCRPSRR